MLSIRLPFGLSVVLRSGPHGFTCTWCGAHTSTVHQPAWSPSDWICLGCRDGAEYVRKRPAGRVAL